MSAILSVIGWLFSKIGVTVYQNQYVFKLIIIAVAAYAVCKMYELFSPFLNSKIKSVVMLSILAVSFANPYYVETFVYTGFEWSVGLLLAVWSVYLFKDKKYVRSAIVVFLAITTYQSYVVIFLILTTVYIYLQNNAKSEKTAWISYLRMLLIAGIPAVADILIVKISVAVMNIVIILAYLVQASCNIRTAVPVLSGQWFLQHPDRIPVPSRQDDIYSLLYSFVPTLSFTTSAA